MNNGIEIHGHEAVVAFDPDIGMFLGELLCLSGGADFHAESVAGLTAQGRKSLEVYLSVCREKGVEPYRAFSGKFNPRLDPKLHEKATFAAAAEGKSLNAWVAEAIEAAAASA